MSLFEDYDVPLHPDKTKTKQDMEERHLGQVTVSLQNP
jgi:hypothetical protein